MNTIKINNIPSNIKARVVDFNKEYPTKEERDKADNFLIFVSGLVIFWVFKLNYKYNKGKI